MSAPNYDWLSNLTTVQQKFLEDNYKDLWYCYKTYGYNVMLYDHARDIDTVYDRVKSVRLVEKVELSGSFREQVEQFYKKQLEINQLKEIVVPVKNYHIILVADDLRLDSELRKAVKGFPVFMRKELTDEELRCQCNAIVFDDVTYKVTSRMLEECEMLSVPYIRRSVVGWSEPAMVKDTENLLRYFAERHKPCKSIR